MNPRGVRGCVLPIGNRPQVALCPVTDQNVAVCRTEDVIQHAIVDVAQEPFAGQQVSGRSGLKCSMMRRGRNGTPKAFDAGAGKDRNNAFSVRTFEQMVFDGSENQFKPVGDFPNADSECGRGSERSRGDHVLPAYPVDF